MSTLETYRKHAKRLVRWHREGNHSIGGRMRALPRFAGLTDKQALAHRFTLTDAQEIVAREAGHADWTALKAACAASSARESRPVPPLRVAAAVPVLFVADVAASATFYRDTLGFAVDFLHGHPPFYGAVSRDGATLHLKWVHAPVFGAGRIAVEGLIMAFLPVENVKALFAEFVAAGAEFAQTLTRQAWGGTDFHVRDPDGNVLAFVG